MRDSALIVGRAVLWSVIGFIAAQLSLLAGIHELGHALAAMAMGIEILDIGWTYIHLEYLNPFVVVAGYTFQMLVSATIACRLFYRKWSRFGWFFVGDILWCYAIWWVSIDRMALSPTQGRLLMDVMFVIVATIAGCMVRKVLLLHHPRKVAMLRGGKVVRSEQKVNPGREGTGCRVGVQA